MIFKIENSINEQVILNGQARAYGLEVLLKKNEGKFQGWLAYTLSKSEQQTKGRNNQELGINNGAWYNTPYDKTHDVSLTGTYLHNEKLRFNANFILQTGQPTTFPNGQYEYNGIRIPNYELRNSSRLPNYHRLDVSVNYKPNPTSEKRWKTEWVFSVYNIYNRMNASSITFRQNTETSNNEAFRLSIFGIIPSVTLNFKY